MLKNMFGPVYCSRLAARGRGNGLVGCISLSWILFPNPGRGGCGGRGFVLRELAPRSGPRGTTMFTELPAQQSGIVTTNNYDDPEMWGRIIMSLRLAPSAPAWRSATTTVTGRPDLFVVAHSDGCRLFRNLGLEVRGCDARKVGVEWTRARRRHRWKQGVASVDVNNDGRLDIYVCRFNAANLLYINQGNGTFKEMAQSYGLDVKDSSVMAAFCDYDRDGWLDVFIQTNLLDFNARPHEGQRESSVAQQP